MATSERLLLDHEFFPSNVSDNCVWWNGPERGDCRQPRAAHYAAAEPVTHNSSAANAAPPTKCSARSFTVPQRAT